MLPVGPEVYPACLVQDLAGSLIQRFGAQTALHAPSRSNLRSHPHFSDGGCKPKRLMAKKITLTIPITK